MKSKKNIKSSLAKEDLELETILSESGWKDVSNDSSKAEFRAAAKHHLEHKKKEARVNIRVQSEDLTKLREIANREGVGYQTLMASIVHKFAQGSLIDKMYLEQIIESLRAYPRL